MKEILLIWTLVAGEPYDVNAFLDRDSCIAAKAQWEKDIEPIKLARPELASVAFVGCEPVSVNMPVAPIRKESM